MQKGNTLSLSNKFHYEHEELFLDVESHTVELPNGKKIENWPFINATKFINVLAISEEGKFICLRQTKYCLDEKVIAPVGGYIKKNETPIVAAKRELREETGYEAMEWINLGEYRVDPNWGISSGYLFLARTAHKIGEPKKDDFEDQGLIYLTQSELESALTTGKIKVFAWATLVALSLMYIKRTSST
jgi:ADP-ribose pyrophosphatase